MKDDNGNPVKYLNLKLDFSESLMVFMLFISSCFFTVFAGFGLSAVPWDIFVDYKYRPKPLDEGTFSERKEILLLFAQELREDGKKIAENRNFVSKMKGFEGWK